MRSNGFDITAYGAHNTAKLAAALESPIDPRLLPTISEESSDCEESVQKETIKTLRERGYKVLQTSVRYKSVKCPDCGCRFFDHQGTGQTPGIPDLLIQLENDPSILWMGLEMKGAHTKISQAQKDLRAEGRLVIAKTAKAALDAVDQTFRGLVPTKTEDQLNDNNNSRSS